MKRLHSLLQLGAAKPSVESNTDEAAVVNQPTEGQPTVQPTSEVLTDEQKAEQARQKADEATPADGSVPSTEVPGVSQESDGGAGVTAPVATETNPTPNNTVDTGDGSQPATAADDLSSEAAVSRADVGTPVVASQESQETGVVAPVSTETKPELNNKVDTGDGSQPATPSDQPGDTTKRADEGKAGAPTELAPELEQVVVKAPQTTSVAADANNPDKEGKTGEAPANPVNTTSTQDSAIEGKATPKETTSTETSAVSQENLSPEDIAKVATVAAAVGAATAAPAAAPEVPAVVEAAPAATVPPVEAAVVEEAAEVATTGDAAIAGADGAGVAAPGEVPVDGQGNAVDAAAQAAAATVAEGPTGDTPPGPNAGDAAATPGEAAKVAADLIAANPDNAAEIAKAIDTVADAGVAAAGGGEEAAANLDADVAAQNDADAAELEESTDDRLEDEDDLDDLEDVEDESNVSQESLASARELLTSLEAMVETALQNGGLSDDAAQLLQTVTDHVTNEAGLDDTDLGLESLAYCDRKNATNYALGRLQATIESIDGELKISTEGFFDIFRSFASKMKDWVASSRRNVAAAKATIKDQNKSATVTLPGEDGDFAAIASLSANTLTDVLGVYGKKAYVAAKTLTDLGKELADGDNHYETVSGKISGIDVGFPSSFNQPTPSGMGDGKASGVLLGDFALALSLDNRDSESDIVKVREKHQGEVTGAQAIAALDESIKVIDAVSNFISQFDGMKKTANDSGDRHVTGATYLASVMGPAALLSADYRRAVYRQFTNSKDPQNNKAGEVVAGFELVKDAASASRKYVAALIAISTKVAG